MTESKPNQINSLTFQDPRFLINPTDSIREKDIKDLLKVLESPYEDVGCREVLYTTRAARLLKPSKNMLRRSVLTKPDTFISHH
jgi:hypothetical protein